MAPPAVELRECSKRFGERVALRRVAIAVAPGETLAVMGANGSGKSTLLRLVAGLSRPTAGAALIDGVAAHDLSRQARGRIGYVAHRPLVYRGLTARENVALVVRLHRRSAVAGVEALAAVGLESRADDRIDGFSRGMLQRLALARVLCHDPDLWLLDEPATGLDADGQELLGELITARRKTATVLYATHDESAARSVGDRLIRLVGGELAG